MKLTSKIIKLFFILIIILLAIDGYLSVRRETELFDHNMKQDALILGRAMKELISDAWKTKGQQQALKLIGEANRGEQQIQVRWIWVEAQPSDSFKPRVSKEKLEPVLHGDEISFKETDMESPGYRYTYVPVSLGNKKHGALELSESLSELKSYTRESIFRLVALATLILVVYWLIVMVVGVSMVEVRLDQLIDKIQNMGKGDFSGDLVLHGQDELSDMAAALNQTCKQLASLQGGK